MINFKQQELADKFYQTLKDKYPEIQFDRLTESPEDPSDLWLYVSVPYDDDKQIEMDKFAGMLTSDILVEHGWFILLMSYQAKKTALAA